MGGCLIYVRSLVDMSRKRGLVAGEGHIVTRAGPLTALQEQQILGGPLADRAPERREGRLPRSDSNFALFSSRGWPEGGRTRRIAFFCAGALEVRRAQKIAIRRRQARFGPIAAGKSARVAPGGYPPGAPTDPDVRVYASGSSGLRVR